ncbi:hypothetical protein P872_14875 [Rhodonellum psychrophilum GCM71 = DSM 17998]|uniref:Uncharacterized protein n=1 Tax=Rhodonellum psychrophilum GCM71 = DSM 17998 TaxID=1123057 RepID=U5C5X6_9BACT|nr:hypothetical protein P872_14875 [Rhodonellum psychrophilum GCM71 = DSM 17998]
MKWEKQFLLYKKIHKGFGKEKSVCKKSVTMSLEFWALGDGTPWTIL